MQVLEAKNRFDRMTSYTVDFEKFMNPTKLFSDYIRGSMSDFYRYDFTDNKSLYEVSRALDSSNYDRQAIYEAILEPNRKLGATSTTLANIELLRTSRNFLRVRRAANLVLR